MANLITLQTSKAFILPQSQISYGVTPQAAAYYKPDASSKTDSGSAKKNLWDDFWESIDWKKTFINLVALATAGYASTRAYKALVHNTGIGKTISSSPVGEFYTSQKNTLLRHISEKFNLDALDEHIQNNSTPEQRKQIVSTILTGNLDELQALINNFAGDSAINLRETVENARPFFLAHDISADDILNGKKPLFGQITEKLNGTLALFGENKAEDLLANLAASQGGIRGATSSLMDEAVGRLGTFAIGYSLISGLSNQLSQLQNGNKSDSKHKKEHDIFDSGVELIEQLVLIALGASSAGKLAGKFNLTGLGKTGLVAAGALGGFALAELLGHVTDFIYRKVQDSLPEGEKDNLLYKTALGLAMPMFIAWLLYAKGIGVKFAKFSAALKNPNLRPTANGIVALMSGPTAWYSGMIGKTFNTAESQLPKFDWTNPAHWSGSPYAFLNKLEDHTNAVVDYVSSQSGLTGSILKLMNKMTNIFSGFPLLQKELRKTGELNLNAKYWSLGALDIAIKLVNKALIAGVFGAIAFPFAYAFNWLKDKFFPEKHPEDAKN